MKLKRAFLPLAAATVFSALTACGGGGGGGGGDSSNTASLSGFAAKGTLKFATVTAYAVGADGKVATLAAVPATKTDKDGLYELKGLTPGQQYVLKVTPNADTVHVDEVSKADQKLSNDFVLSAPSKPSSGSSTVSITPFSHQVVEAATKAGGLSSDNVAKAKAMITELVGFDPISIAKNDNSTPQAKQLKVLLTAVSQMASDGALGCGSAADKTTCVIANLAAATSITSLKLQKDSLDVSSAFKTAINKTVTEFQKSDPSIASAMTNVLGKLQCESNCTPVKPVDSGTSTAVAKIRTVLDEIRTDLSTMFSNDGVTEQSKGKLNMQAFKFKQAVDKVQIDVLGQTQSDLRALLLGAQLYLDAKNGGSVSNYSKGTRPGELSVWANLNPWQVAAEGCSLYKDVQLSVLATSASEVNFVGCSARFARGATYNGSSNQSTFTEWRHIFLLTPDSATLGKFTYGSKALKTTWTCTGTVQQNNSGQGSPSVACGSRNNENLQSDGTSALTFSGTLTATLSNNTVSAVAITGELPAGFKRSQVMTGPANLATLATDVSKTVWNLSAAVTALDVQGDPARVTASGEVSKFLGSTKLNSVKLAEGSFMDSATYSARLDLVATNFTSTNNALVSGVLSVDTPVTDSSGTKTMPTRLRFAGALSNSEPGQSKVDFLEGALDVTVSNFNRVNATLPNSAGNSTDIAVSFSGSVTAPEQPRLEVVVSVSGKSHDVENTATMNVSYNRWVGSTKSRTVNMAVARAPASSTTLAVQTFTISEASSGLSMTFKEYDDEVDVLANSSKVGVLDQSKGLMTFTDGTVVSLELGW